MAKAVRVAPEARQEMRQAARRYEERSAGLGMDFLTAIDEAISRAARLGPDCRPAVAVPADLGVRRVLAKRFPYVVFFVELRSSIRIIALGHERREPGFWRGRLGG